MVKKRVGNKVSVRVADFLEAGSERLKLNVVAGRLGMRHLIGECTINRPGLGLAGFFKHFPEQRIQVIGLAEHAYLESLSVDERTKRFDALFAKKIPCIVFARGKRVYPEIKELSEKYKIPLLRTPLITKHFVNASTIIMENLQAPHTKLQGTMVEIMGMGVLIEGRSGVGKSDTALALLKRGHSLVSDDITALRKDTSGSIIGYPVKVTQYHMEIRGLGIIHVPSLFGVASVRESKRLDLVVTLCRPNNNPVADELPGAVNKREVLGIEIPQVFITVENGRDISNVVETAALNMRLRKLGHDAEKELDEQLIALLEKGHEIRD